MYRAIDWGSLFTGRIQGRFKQALTQFAGISVQALGGTLSTQIAENKPPTVRRHRRALV